MAQTLYLHCSEGDVAPRVLLTGDPGRLDLFAEVMDEAQEVGNNREYRVISGRFEGRRVSAVSAGIGAPSTAIALEELKQVGVQSVVRVGTMMGIGAPLGTVVTPVGAVRMEGTSRRYLPLEYPAVPDWHLTAALKDSAVEAGLDARLGLSATFDAFYPDMAPALGGDNYPDMDYALLRRRGVLSLDMESALLFVAGRALGLASAAFCLVTVAAGNPPGFLDDARRAALTRRLIEAALRGVIRYEPGVKEEVEVSGGGQ
ncbi:MAG: nucleoside phosphorylase [Chloroflexota bacterium]